MTYKEMDDLLALSLNEINQAGDSPFEFTPTMRQTFLNMGQNEAIRLLNKHHLSVLDTDVTGKALVGGSYYDLTGLSVLPFDYDKGLDGVLITGGKYCDKLSFQEVKDKANARQTFSNDRPRYYVRGTRIYILPTQATDATIALSYRREPNKMYLSVSNGDIKAGVTYLVNGYTTFSYNNVSKTDGMTFVGLAGNVGFSSTGTGYVSACCEFSENIQMAILEFAKHYGFDIGNDSRRASDAYNKGLMKIENINASAAPTDTITNNNPVFDELDEEAVQFGGTFNIVIPT